MGMLKEFKEFAVRGNVIDMAVGIVIGGAFGKIVSSLVEKVIMPLAGYLTGGIDFSKAQYTFPAVLEGRPPVTVSYGAFLQTVIDFTIIAFAIFLVVKAINTAKKRFEGEKTVAKPIPEDVRLLQEIRDLLKARV
jgi:large conductance mechanosensitive channel